MQDPGLNHSSYDVVVVGARCAGAATALLLARAGAKVLLIDRQKRGADTVSTHAIMRAGVLLLKRWGLLSELMACGTPAIRRSTFHYGPDAVTVTIGSDHGVDFLCAPRRTVLDRLLVEAAETTGADVHHDMSLIDLEFDGHGRVTGAVLKDAGGRTWTVSAGIVVGADGRQSTVARQVRAQTRIIGSGASGYVYGYFAGLPDDGFHWHFGQGVAAGVIPTNHAQHCVFVAVPDRRFAAVFRGDLDAGFRGVLAANSPALADGVARARLQGRLRGFAGGGGYLRQSYGPGWALVGDAAYFKDPLTAHGITDALRDAEFLARAAIDGNPQAFVRYQEERDDLSRPLFAVTDEIASFEWDLEAAKQLHARLSAAMKRETERVAAFPARDALAA